ncbi:MAG: TRAP transporter large permease [Deltaproteobacteria bacterium]|nr:TRAP transporter large permease [Deltaproteobacteria bacterium]MBW2096815.1 TRAP transporter large permease [Deltaproteobacteria bacterium]
MSPLTIGALGIVLLMIFLFMRMPIAVAMGVVGVMGMSVVVGVDAGLSVLKTAPFAAIAKYGFSVVPLFILMGNFCFHAGVSRDLYYTVNRWIGHFRGGLAMATVGACAGFAAVSGSSLATAATMGTVALPEMKKYKYSPELATGSISAGGTLGILIPPSVVLVIYGILTEQSIAALFLAGFIPGILEAIFYIIAISIVCRINPQAGPAGPKSSFSAKIISLKDTWPILTLFIIVIGGIYAGIFSPTEAAGIGAFFALIIAIVKRALDPRSFFASLEETMKSTAMIFTILIGAMVLGYFMTATRLPFELANVVSGLEVNRYIIFSLILIVYIILGCIMIPMAMVILTIPIVFPLVVAQGFDPIWFGIITVRIFEIAQITPPVGMNVFVISGVAGDVPMGTIYKGIIPFLIADICHLILLIAFPQIALFLPGLMS